MERIPHFINGALISDAERYGPVFNPATGEQEKEVALASAARVEEAIQAARAALPGWRATSLAKRTTIFFKVRELLMQRRPELAALLTSEHGKVLSDAEGEITRGLENIEFATGLSHALKGERSEQVAGGVDVHSVRQPVGVVACITPFNFPAMVPLWMIGSALACGNTVLLKPSEKDPSSANFIAQVFAEAGLPAGVLNVVHGDKEAVDVLLEHPDVKAISFVG
jgi:malonate-semialdehyde dehydrogenase (acetylating)/methylmalonate-semialdehyde dehydrogenase